MRTSRWDTKLPKQLEGRPPLRPLRKQMSRSLSPRPRGPVGLSMLRPPPPSPSYDGTSSPLLLPTRSPTPPQTMSGIKYINKTLDSFNANKTLACSSAPTTPTSSRKTLEVPGRNARVSSPTRESRIPTKLSSPRSLSTSPSRFQSKTGQSSSLTLSSGPRHASSERNIGGVKMTPPTAKKFEFVRDSYVTKTLGSSPKSPRSQSPSLKSTSTKRPVTPTRNSPGRVETNQTPKCSCQRIKEGGKFEKKNPYPISIVLYVYRAHFFSHWGRII